MLAVDVTADSDRTLHVLHVVLLVEHLDRFIAQLLHVSFGDELALFERLDPARNIGPVSCTVGKFGSSRHIEIS